MWFHKGNTFLNSPQYILYHKIIVGHDDPVVKVFNSSPEVVDQSLLRSWCCALENQSEIMNTSKTIFVFLGQCNTWQLRTSGETRGISAVTEVNQWRLWDWVVPALACKLIFGISPFVQWYAHIYHIGFLQQSESPSARHEVSFN